MNKKETVLIVGGTSGLGLELAQLLQNEATNNVYVTGRKKSANQKLSFIYFDIDGTSKEMVSKIDTILSELPEEIDLLIYAAGFCQNGNIKDLSDLDIMTMINVGLLVPALLINRILKHQKKLSGFIAITSTSQWIPRVYEPVYTAVKAGLGMLAHSLSLDPQIGKVLVAAPAGMKTNFWTKVKRDTRTMLDPVWVAKQIQQLYVENEFKYKYARILRDPQRVEIVEKR